MADLLMIKYKKVFPLPQTRILTEPDYLLKTKSKSITPLVKTGENSLCVGWFESRFDPMLLLPPNRKQSSFYSRRHLLVFLPRLACSAARVAISKTSLTPSFVFAEHSMYPKALILAVMSRPSSGFTGSCFILASSLRVCSSFRRSFLFPTSIIGTLGQKCLTSGVHFSGMFSRLSGLSIEKHIRMTSVSG